MNTKPILRKIDIKKLTPKSKKVNGKLKSKFQPTLNGKVDVVESTLLKKVIANFNVPVIDARFAQKLRTEAQHPLLQGITNN